METMPSSFGFARLLLFPTILLMLLIILSLGAASRRLHDTGRSGKILWLYAVPFGLLILMILLSAMLPTIRPAATFMRIFLPFSLYYWTVITLIFIVWCSKAGTPGSNRYGEL